MTFARIDKWMRERATEPELLLCRHEAQAIRMIPLELALSMSLEDARKYSNLQGRVTMWAREWGRTCEYDKERDAFVLTRTGD